MSYQDHHRRRAAHTPSPSSRPPPKVAISRSDQHILHQNSTSSLRVTQLLPQNSHHTLPDHDIPAPADGSPRQAFLPLTAALMAARKDLCCLTRRGEL